MNIYGIDLKDGKAITIISNLPFDEFMHKVITSRWIKVSYSTDVLWRDDQNESYTAKTSYIQTDETRGG